MVTKYLKLFAATVVALFALAACQNERTIELYGEGGDPNALDVTFTIKDYDEVTLRSHLRPEDEHNIENLVVWVFDKHEDRVEDVLISHDPKKDFGFVLNENRPTNNSEGSVDKGIPFGGTKTKGKLAEKLSLQIKQNGGNVTIVALANFASDNFVLEDAEGGVYNSEEQFKKITTLDQLRKLRLNLNKRNNEHASSERYESPLLYGVEKVTPDDFKNKSVISIQLVPFIAKITAMVKPGNDVTINSISYHFQNIPTSTKIFSALAKSQDSKGELNLKDTPSAKMMMDYNKKTKRVDSFQVLGYLVPNYPEPKKAIDSQAIADAQARKKEGKSGYTAFDLRQKRMKADDKGGYVKNGDWEYAPDEATALVMEADLVVKKGTTEQQATVTYTVVLGDFSGVTDWINPTSKDLKKINNYNIESATHYNYTITINGVNNIIVEATSPNKLDEPNPSVEGGTVVGDKAVYQLDSHYEQRTFILAASDFGIFADQNVQTKTLLPNAKLEFMIRTPFQPYRLVSYTKSDAENLLKNGIPDDKKVDNDWLRIYVHKPFNKLGAKIRFDNNNLPSILYSETTSDASVGTSVSDFWDKTLTVEQFIAWMLTEPATLFDANNAICITLFVDEYYYDWDPTKVAKEDRRQDNKDKDLWKVFANAPDRKFSLLTGGIHKSADQQSLYTNGTYLSISQYSIKTFFTEDPDGIRVWGVESIDETPNIPFFNAPPTSTRRFMNDSNNNGWMNTLNVIAAGYRIRDEYGIGGFMRWSGENNMYIICNSLEPETLRKLKFEKIYSSTTKATPKGLALASGYYQSGGRTENASMSPMTRNRDDNRDNLMQANELKWYIPAQMQANMITANDHYLPAYAQLDAPASPHFGTQYSFVMFTSTLYSGSGNGVSNSLNGLVIAPEFESVMPYFQATANGFTDGGATSSYDRMRTTSRLVRNLGFIDYNSNDRPDGYSKNFDREYYKKEPMTWIYFKPNLTNLTTADRKKAKDHGGVFVIKDYLDPNVLRRAFVDSELPIHTESDAANRVYYKGFRMSKQFVNDGTKAANTLLYKQAELNNLLYSHNSPCKTYTEEGAKGIGRWRLPNLVEISIMGCGTEDANDFISAASTAAQPNNIWTSTVISSTETRRGIRNYSLYYNGYMTYPMSSFAPGYGKSILDGDWAGAIRCVRDLTDEEYDRYQSEIHL